VYTRRTRQISHQPSPFSSDMSSIVCTEWNLYHPEDYLWQFVRWSSDPGRDFAERLCALAGETRMGFCDK
jgi:hypothetical protein